MRSTIAGLLHLVFVTVIVVICGSAVAQQPRYEGKTQADWEADLRDLSPAVRFKAAQALPSFGPQSVPALLPAVIDREQRIVQAATEALKRVGPAGLPTLSGFETHGGFGKALRSLLWELLDGRPNSDSRKAALKSLRALPSSPTISVLSVALKNPDKDVGASSIAALGIMGPNAKGAIPLLTKLFGDDPLAVGPVLGTMGRDTLPFLVRAAKGASIEQRMGALSGLSEMAQGVGDPSIGMTRAIDTKFRDSLGPKLAAETSETLIPLLTDVNAISWVPNLLVALAPASTEPMIRAYVRGGTLLRQQILLVFQKTGEVASMANDSLAKLRKLQRAGERTVAEASGLAIQAVEKGRK